LAGWLVGWLAAWWLGSLCGAAWLAVKLVGSGLLKTYINSALLRYVCMGCGWLLGCLVGWLIGRLSAWLVGCRDGWLVGCGLRGNGGRDWWGWLNCGLLAP